MKQIVELSSISTGTYLCDTWGAPEELDAVILTINDKQYITFVDPNDGYRSYSILLPVSEENKENIKYTVITSFEPQKIIMEEVKTEESEEECSKKMTYFRNIKDNSIILEIGTMYYDNFYPVGIMHYYPENLPINKGKN